MQKDVIAMPKEKDLEKPKISVLTVSNRFGGADVTWNTLRRQTFRDFEWIFCDSIYNERHEVMQRYAHNDLRIKHSKQSPKDPTAKTWLAHAENEAIKLAQGELIVFLQDFIWIQPDALEKFWNQYLEHPKAMITGVGDQYKAPAIDDPKGLITVFKYQIVSAPYSCVWKDPRKRQDNGSFYECLPMDWEANWAMCPRKMLYDIGGFDEEYDYLGFAFDNCSVAERAAMLGYTPYIDQSNESYSLNCDEWAKSPAKTEENFRAIATFHANRIKLIKEGKYPIKLNYL